MNYVCTIGVLVLTCIILRLGCKDLKMSVFVLIQCLEINCFFTVFFFFFVLFCIGETKGLELVYSQY